MKYEMYSSSAIGALRRQQSDIFHKEKPGDWHQKCSLVLNQAKEGEAVLALS